MPGWLLLHIYTGCIQKPISGARTWLHNPYTEKKWGLSKYETKDTTESKMQREGKSKQWSNISCPDSNWSPYSPLTAAMFCIHGRESMAGAADKQGRKLQVFGKKPLKASSSVWKKGRMKEAYQEFHRFIWRLGWIWEENTRNRTIVHRCKKSCFDFLFIFSSKEQSKTILQHHEHQGNHQMYQGISYQFLLQTTKLNCSCPCVPASLPWSVESRNTMCSQ